MSDFDTLVHLADNLYSRYEAQGNPSDLSLCIVRYRSAFTLARTSTALSNDARSKLLSNLANALSIRFQRHGDIADLDHSVECHLAALDLRPPKHPGRAKALSNFATVLLVRYGKLGMQKDIELAIEHFNTALPILPPDGRLMPLMNYASALLSRFQRSGDVADLNDAIRQYRAVMDAAPAENKSTSYYNLANALLSRFKLQRDLKDLELCIEYSTIALHGLSESHPDRVSALSCLSTALIRRFESRGDLEDLQNAADALMLRYKLAKHFFALELHTVDLPRRVLTLEALGVCLDIRFERFGDPEDLHIAIDLYNEALWETSQDDPRRPFNLLRSASSLETRFRLYGEVVDLDRSISYCREALELLPLDHPDRATPHRMLTSSLLLRFGETGDEFDLDIAQLHCHVSMNTQDVSDSLRASCNLLLARIFKARVRPWVVKDVESIFQHLRAAKDLCTLTHPLISDVYAELASAYYLRFLVQKKPNDLHEAFGHHELSMNVASGSSWPAFRASLQWVRDAEGYGHRSGIDIYRNALRQINHHISSVRSPELRQSLARRYGSSLAYDGTSFTLRFQEPMAAVEALESGRSVLWSQLVRAKTIFDELRLTGEYGTTLADDLERLSSQLEHVHRASKSAKDVKSLLKEKESILDQIRRVEGFKYFLKTTPFSELAKATIDGPVVLLNASQYTCDALILLYSAPPIHVPLSHLTPKDVLQMATRFRGLTESLSPGRHDDETLELLLGDIWDLIALPVVQHVLPHVPIDARLWWCPSGVFTSIPLHAAGPYRQHEPNLSQLYVSSYTPTLQALIRARAATPQYDPPRSRRSSIVPGFLKNRRSRQLLISPTTTSPTIVAIGHAVSDETCHELDRLRNRLPPSMPFRRMEGEDVTTESILATVREPVWLHLACAASLDASLPCRSGFATRDGTVSMYDVSQACPQAEFVFLSGRCSRGEDAVLGETMHLAASLQYSGVRSTIGTLWPVDEEVMRRVADAFYEIVLKGGGPLQYTNTARALNEALGAVGRGIPLAQRIAFVHVGA
ncbi:hypothetical protein JVU11DRAFT_3674 [Chiua virens]|nr:hypothetical protein JVU11DRAFT_3674 [Chiua virens]